MELFGERVGSVDDNDLPVGLAFVQQADGAQDLDLLDLSGRGAARANFYRIDRVVVALEVSVLVDDFRAFPRLHKAYVDGK